MTMTADFHLAAMFGQPGTANETPLVQAADIYPRLLQRVLHYGSGALGGTDPRPLFWQ